MIFVTRDTHREIDIGKLSNKKFPLNKELSKNDYIVVAGDFDFVMNGKDFRDAAVEKLTDHAILTDLAGSDKDWRVRVAAYRKLGNAQAAKREIAIHDSNQFQLSRKWEK